MKSVILSKIFGHLLQPMPLKDGGLAATSINENSYIFGGEELLVQ